MSHGGLEKSDPSQGPGRARAADEFGVIPDVLPDRVRQARCVSDSTGTSDGTAGQFWEIRLGVYCSPGQVRALVDRIQLLCCPDPDHAPPCPIPWDSSHWSLDDHEAAEQYPALVEQVRVEHGPR